MTINGGISFWHAELGGAPALRAPLAGDTSVDVCIVGAGYTGLWAAYYLKRADPALKVMVLEQRFAGFGGSGRNGGWLSGAFEWSRDRYLASGGSRAGVIAMQTTMAASVEEVIARAEEEGIAADIRRCDKLLVARNAAQSARLRAYGQEMLDWDVPADRLSWLDGAAAQRRIALDQVESALVIHDVARVQPAKLARGLAVAAERRGVVIHEGTRVTAIHPGRVETAQGTVRAGTILRATEGFTASLPGLEREWLPLNSAIIATEPLSEAQWRAIGWDGHEILGDFAHAYFYAQRTASGRIAFGGRGIPYRYGSRTDTDGQTQAATIRILHATLLRHLPQLRGVGIEHGWCGVLGVPRDWCATVGLDPATRIGWAGGYVGLGVSTSNVAGRTLADLTLGRESDLACLPWVNRRVKRWEPEPLRWLAVNGLYAAYRQADRMEEDGRADTALIARLADRIVGH